MPENNNGAGIMTCEVGVKNQIGKLIDKFYIENIKSVVFIDDDFSTLETLLASSMNDVSEEELSVPVEDEDDSRFKSAESAGTEDTHTKEREENPVSKGGESPYMCKTRVYHLVSSAHKKGFLVDILKDYPSDNDFWKRADLLVLDYLFNGSPDKTLATLKQLSDESDYNLVVVYTNQSKVAAENVSTLLNCRLDAESESAEPESETKEGQGLYHRSADLTDHPWIACRNLFIVFVPKTYEERDADINDLVEALKNALKQYGPSPMEVLGRVVATDLRQNIHENIHRMLPSREDKASALFASIHDMKDMESSEERRLALNKILTVLFRKADSVLSLSAAEELSQLICEVREGCGSTKDFQFVCKLENAFDPARYPDMHYAYLNNFICNDTNIPKIVTTGTIFFIKDSKGNDKYYICVSPECDLARGRIIKILAVNIDISDINKDKLKNVHKNKYILFNNKDVIKMGNFDPLNIHIENFLLHKTDHPKYYHFKDEKDTQINDIEKQFFMIFSEVQVNIVAQLRPEYAHRFMALTGAWHGRIGLDFISIPDKSKKN